MAYTSQPSLRGIENRPRHVGLNDEYTALGKALRFTPKRYPAGTVIVSQGEACDRVFIIQSGWGCISHELAGGERQILDFALRDDIILPQSSAGNALETFAAQTELSVLMASTEAFSIAATRSPDLFSLILETLVHRGAVIAQHLTNVGRRSALARTAHLFLELRARLDRTGAVTRNSYECPLTQYDLADALGLTPIHVNRMLRELRELKVLEFRKGHVSVLDQPGLTKLAGFESEYVDRRSISPFGA